MKNKIFLSYSYDDRQWAEHFAFALEKEGIDVWFGRDLPLGEDIRDHIQSALRASNTLIVLLSPKSIKNSGIFFELGAAVAGNKRIIPIIIDDVGNEQLPLPVIKYQYLRESSPVSAAKMVVKVVQN